LIGLSRKGEFHENAAMESFDATLKCERVGFARYATRARPETQSLNGSSIIQSPVIAPEPGLSVLNRLRRRGMKSPNQVST
jgi:hypothetical protein